MNGPTTSARDLAVLALRDREGNVSAHLERRLGTAGLGPEDAALARELALGIVRRRGTIEAVLQAFLSRPDRRLPGALNEVLLLGLYQLLFLERVPAFAAVNEAVEQATRFRHRRQSGLVNGVLRTVSRGLSAMTAGPPPRAVDVIPCGPATYRKADRAVFPDPSSLPAEYLAAAYSLPEELARRWTRRFGGLDGATALAAQCNVRAPLTLRVNARLATVESAIAELAAGGAEARPHANGHSVVLPEGGNVTGLEAFRRGAVQPQDASATGVVLAAEPQPGMSVLDFCAAPGTKTTHLAECMRNEGRIVAVDVSEEKLSRVESNCRRMGVGIVTTVLADQIARLELRSFDLVLVDVPCSNTGVLARRAEARWRFTEEALPALAQDQRLLVRAAGQYVRPGGRLVYSTCSIEPEENSEVAAWLQKNEPRIRLEKEELTLPGGAEDPTQWRDGGYLAIFRAT